jgi:hypothetical protein
MKSSPVLVGREERGLRLIEREGTFVVLVVLSLFPISARGQECRGSGVELTWGENTRG